VSQDDPDNPIGVQNIEAGETMQDFKNLGDKLAQKIDTDMISKLNADQRRIFHRVIIITSDKSLLRGSPTLQIRKNHFFSFHKSIVLLFENIILKFQNKIRTFKVCMASRKAARHFQVYGRPALETDFHSCRRSFVFVYTALCRKGLNSA